MELPCNWVTSSLERFSESFFVFEIVVEALPRLKFGASHAESHNFIFYKLELGAIANIESWENDFEYKHGLKSLSYSYSLLMLTSSTNDNDNDNDTDDDSEQFL